MVLDTIGGGRARLDALYEGPRRGAFCLLRPSFDLLVLGLLYSGQISGPSPPSAIYSRRREPVGGDDAACDPVPELNRRGGIVSAGSQIPFTPTLKKRAAPAYTSRLEKSDLEIKEDLMHRSVVFALAISLAGIAFAGTQAKTQKISKKLVDRAKDTVKELEKLQKQLDKTMKQERKLLGKKKAKDRIKEHKKLREELGKTEKAVARVRKKAEGMEKEAEKFFAEWSKGLERIGDEELRAMSQKNLDSSRSRYGQIVGSGRLAASQYDAFLRGMKDSLAYLELDLSDEAIAQLEPKSHELAVEASKLKSSVEIIVRKIEGYIDALR